LKGIDERKGIDMNRRTSWPGLIMRAALLGFDAGLRSLTPLALLALRQPNAPRIAGWKRWYPLRHRWSRAALVAAGAGELVADKLPQTPSRIEPPQLAGRALMGGIAGLAIASTRHGFPAYLVGAILGAAGAIAGSYAGYHARKAIGDATSLPDPAVALGEDAIAIGLGRVTIRG
jgi:uncharacterized membrane protein